MARPTKESSGEEKLKRAVFYLHPKEIEAIHTLNPDSPSESHAGRIVVQRGLEALRRSKRRRRSA